MNTPADLSRRIQKQLPNGWFSDNSPVKDAIISGLGAGWAPIRDGLDYVELQSRLLTATDYGLDIAVYDFLGDRLVRKTGETDARFRIRAQREILRPKVTRQAMSDAIYALTGHRPLIFEPCLASDTGGWGRGFAYGQGAWGSRNTRAQVFITAYRPIGGGPPGISGYGVPEGSYGRGSFAYQSEETLRQGVTDQDIRDCILSVKAEGVVVWLKIKSPLQDTHSDALDIDFQLDISGLD